MQILFITGCFAILFERPRTFSVLETTRPEISFVPYTPMQRQTIADSMYSLFQIYVNRESKIQFYTADKDIDPFPHAQRMQRQAKNMTDGEFHYGYVDLFSSQRDFHAQYLMPGPHCCYTAMQPLIFTLVSRPRTFRDVVAGKVKSATVNSNEVNEMLVVKAFHENEKVRSLSPTPETSIGDELLFINNLTFAQYIQQNKRLISGANDFGAKRNAVGYLSLRDGRVRKMPEEDGVWYTMRKRNGRVYRVWVKWVVARDDGCYNTVRRVVPVSGSLNGTSAVEASVVESFADSTESGPTDTAGAVAKPVQAKIKQLKASTTKHQPTRKEKEMVKKTLQQMKNSDLETFKAFFPQPPLRPSIKYQDTSDPGVKWTIWKRESQNIGIIVLSSFAPVSNNPTKITDLVKFLMLNQLSKTNALLIDVRDNQGGLIALSESIGQLFGSNVQGTVGRAVVDDINQSIFFSSVFDRSDPWVMAYGKTTPNDAYSPLVPFTMDEISFGQAYIKPVGIYTNARCYSACDLFAATVRDNNIGFVFGEDGSTGGGGANVVTYDFLTLTDPKSFPPMPYPELKEWGQDARVAWRQAVRVKQSAGKLIEDFGIETDIIVQPTLDDLIGGNSTRTVYDVIGDKLNLLSKVLRKSNMNFKATPEREVDVVLGSSVEIELETSEIQNVVVYAPEGYILNRVTIANTTTLVKSKAVFDYKATKPGFYRFKIQAFDIRRSSVFTTFRTFRFIAPERKSIEPGTTTLDFIGSYTGIFETRTKPNSGWNRNATSLKIGDGKVYNGNIDSTISWFLQLPEGQTEVQVAVVVEYDTEAGYDFFYFGYSDLFGTYQLLLGQDAEGGEVDAVSGKGVLNQTYTINVEGNPELFMRFVSDAQTNLAGVTVRSLQVIL